MKRNPSPQLINERLEEPAKKDEHSTKSPNQVAALALEETKPATPQKA